MTLDIIDNHHFYEKNGFVLKQRGDLEPDLGFGFYTYKKDAHQVEIALHSIVMRNTLMFPKTFQPIFENWLNRRTNNHAHV